VTASARKACPPAIPSPGERFPDERFPGERFPGERFPGERFPDGRFPDGRFPGELSTGRRPAILVIGMSHAGAPLAWLRSSPDPDVEVAVVTPDVPEKGIAAFMTERVGETRPHVLVSMVDGNHHNKLGLLEVYDPYDFEDPAAPGLLAQRRPLPRAVVRAALEDVMTRSFALLRHLRSLWRGPMAHVAAPPPVGDESHLRANLGAFAARAGIAPAFTPASVRMKLYRLQNEILGDLCRTEGVAFVGPPPSALDGDGFLAAPYRLADPTHANRLYGAEVLRMLKKFAAAHVPERAP